MDKKWKAKWITDPVFAEVQPISVFHREYDEIQLPIHKEEWKNRHMLVRKTFHLNQTAGTAFVDITADDYYKLYINGIFVGQGPAPGYHFHYYYNRFDVSGYLKPGENVIAVHVYYQGLINRVWNSGDYRQGMIAEVMVDGVICAASDSSWHYMISKAYPTGQTTGYETQYLENYDSRYAENGWQDTQYDDSWWDAPWENETDDHKLFLQETPALQVYEMRPAQIKEMAQGHYLIDFGTEITGQFKMKAQGVSGQTVEIRCGEELNEEGTGVRYDMRCNCIYRETWTLSGNLDTLDFYDYKAFRYVEVIDPDTAVEPDSFSAVVRHYPMDESRCKWESSNEMLNAVWRICRNGVKLGSQEVYVDCPSREKGQYLGDITVTSLSHMYLTGDMRLFKKALENFAASTFICPGMMAVAPGSLMQEIADFSLQWPMQLLRYYWHSGDLDFLRKMAPVAEEILHYFRQYRRSDGLLANVRGKWNLVDWPDNLRDNYDFPLTRPVSDGCHNVINAFYYGAVCAFNDIRDILHISYQDETIELKAAYIKAFYNPMTKLFTDSEESSHSALHSNVLPLYFGILPDGAKDSIVSLVKQKGLCCGVYMAYFVLKALAAVEEYGLVYDFLVSDSEHSWGNMVKEGASTCFEAWGKDQKWNTSLCHPWGSAPISILVEDIIGLRPAAPGWEKISFLPHIPASLQHLYLEFPIKHGKITVSLDEGDTSIQVPEGTYLETR